MEYPVNQNGLGKSPLVASSKRWSRIDAFQTGERLESDVEGIGAGGATQLALARARANPESALAVRALDLNLDDLARDYEDPRARGAGKLHRPLFSTRYDHSVAVWALYRLDLECLHRWLVGHSAHGTANLALHLSHALRQHVVAVGAFRQWGREL